MAFRRRSTSRFSRSARGGRKFNSFRSTRRPARRRAGTTRRRAATRQQTLKIIIEQPSASIGPGGTLSGKVAAPDPKKARF